MAADEGKTVFERPAGSGPTGTSRSKIVEADRERYVSGDEIARGGMGRVVEATDVRLDRVVAVKEALTDDDESLRRFERETKITARLEHPSIVPVYDAGGPRDAPFYVMRRVSGRPLGDLIAARPGLDERLALIPHLLAAAQAIAHAHGRKILHRDIKPSNILVGELGETVVIDWGLAKVIDEIDDHGPASPSGDELHTRVGTVFGTPGFMAPEQLRGEPAGPKGDVYALGATLYYLLTCRPPHHAENGDLMMELASKGPPVAIADLVDGVPAELSTIVDRALAFDDRRRYDDAAAFAEELQRFLAGQLVASHRYSRRERLFRFVRKHRTAVAIVAIATVVLAVFATIAVARIITERDRADREAQLAQRRLAEQYEEQGRLAFLADRSGAALLYFLAAIDRGAPRTNALDYMIDQAVRRLEAQRWVLRGHTARIEMLDLSPDGTRLLSAGHDGTVRIWDMTTRATIASIVTGDPIVNVARWSSAGDKLLTSGTSGVPRIYSSDGKLLHELAHGQDRSRIKPAYAPDGSRVLVPYLDGTLVSWDVASGTKVASTKSSLANPLDAVISLDGRFAIIKSREFIVEVRDARTLALVTTLVGHKRPISDIAFSQTHVALASKDKTITVWDVATWKLVHHLRGDANVVDSVAFDPSGKRLASANRDGTARVWDVASGEAVMHLVGHKAGITAVRFTPDGTRIVTTSFDGTSRMWDAASGVPLATFEGHQRDVTSLALSNDLVITAGADATARVYPLTSDRRVMLGHTRLPDPFSFSFSSDGGRLASGGEQTVRVWETAAGKPAFELDGASAATFHPHDPTRMVVAYPDELRLLRDGAIEHRVTTSAPRLIEYLPDGQRIAFADRNVLWSWHPASGALTQLAVHRMWINAVDTADDLVVSGSWDETAIITRPSTKASITLRHEKPVMSVAIDPTRRYVVTGSLESNARVWDADSGALVRTLDTRDRTIVIAFDNHGRMLTAGVEPVANVWNLRDGSLVATLEGHTNPLIAAAFTKDGLVVTAGDETVQTWDLATARQLSISRRHSVTIQAAVVATQIDQLVTAGFDRSITLSPIGTRHLELGRIRQVARCLPFELIDGRLLSMVVPVACSK